MARDFAPTTAGGAQATFPYEPAATAPAQGTNLTVCAWVNIDENANTKMIVGRDEDSSADRVYQFRIQNNKVEGIVFFGGGNIGDATGATALSTGTWYFVAMTHNGTTVNVYLNSGTSDGNAAAGGTLDNDQTGIAIGARSRLNDGTTCSEAFDGKIAEVAEWTRALSAAELNLLAAGYSPAFIPNGLNWYVPLIGRNDPELELRRGTTMALTTVTAGTANVYPHPRAIYRRRKAAYYHAAAVGGGGSPVGPLTKPKLVGRGILLGGRLV